MNWPKFALVAIFVLIGLAFIVPWVTGIEIDDWPVALRWALTGVFVVAMIVLGRDEMRKEKEAETWIDDPRKLKLQNWMDRRRERFSPRRGIEFFFVGLVVFSIVAGIGALFGEVASLATSLAFVLIMSVLAGLIGMFTEKIPL